MPTCSVYVPNLTDPTVTPPRVRVTETGHGRSVGDMIEFSGKSSQVDFLFLNGLFPNTKPNLLTGRQLVSGVVDADTYDVVVYYGVSLAASQTITDVTVNSVVQRGIRAICTLNSDVLTIIEPNHDVEVGQKVVFKETDYFQQGWTISRSLNVVFGEELEGPFPVVSVLDQDRYTVSLEGKTPVSAEFPINEPQGYTEEFGADKLLKAGLNTSILGPGWGSGTWSRAGWSTAVASLAGEGLRIWHVDNFGEDLVMNVRDLQNGVFYWDASSGIRSRAFRLSNYSGVQNAPTIATQVLVSEVDRHILCLGANPIFETEQDPMLIRWSSQEDPSDWTPTATNTAGDLRLSQGSRIVVAKKTRRETLVFTDRALFSVQYIGAPYTFGTAQLADNVRIAGPNAVTAINDSVFWMGFENFFTYNGRVQPVPCSVRSFVFDNLNREQLEKVYCSTIASENEIWWFYPSANSDENDKYVTYNYVENLWVTGNMDRTAFIDGASTIRKNPQGTDPNGFMYNHEIGTTRDYTLKFAGSVLKYENQDMGSRIESAYFDIGEGDKRLFVSKILPDINMNSSTAAVPAVDISLKFLDDINQADNLEGALAALCLSITSDMIDLYFDADNYTPQELHDQWVAGSLFTSFDPLLYYSSNINNFWDGAIEDESGPGGSVAGSFNISTLNKIFEYGEDTQMSSLADMKSSGIKKIQYMIDRILGDPIVQSSVSYGSIPFFQGTARFGSGSHRNIATQSVTTTVTPFDNTLNLRNRGRHMKISYKTNPDIVGTAFTVGDSRIDIREDGKR